MTEETTKPSYSKGYRSYVLFILTGVYTFNFFDRQILSILQESIKADLDLSDTQLGLLTGFTFAIFYVTLGIPIARVADRSNRKNVVAISLAVWSAMTAICGMAQNFIQLALARIGVGIGEAGGSPPSHAIISDYYPPEKRATALSTYSTGIYIGIFLAYTLGGVVADNYGWRTVLYGLGIPGILYALIVFFTVKEPIRGNLDKQKQQLGDETTFWDVARLLFSKKTFLPLALACGLHTFASYGVGNFFPPFLIRVHGLSLSEIGIYLGITAGIGGALGTFLGGYLVDKLRTRDVRWYAWISVYAGALHFIPAAIMFFSPNSMLVIVLAFFNQLLGGFYLGPSIAMTYSLVSPKMRAFASAVLFFILNLIGLGLGPVTIGFLSDQLAPTFGAEALRYAFCFTFLTGIVSIYLFYKASTHYKADLETV